jgi:hypothetical protein
MPLIHHPGKRKKPGPRFFGGRAALLADSESPSQKRKRKKLGKWSKLQLVQLQWGQRSLEAFNCCIITSDLVHRQPNLVLVHRQPSLQS